MGMKIGGDNDNDNYCHFSYNFFFVVIDVSRSTDSLATPAL